MLESEITPRCLLCGKPFSVSKVKDSSYYLGNCPHMRMFLENPYETCPVCQSPFYIIERFGKKFRYCTNPVCPNYRFTVGRDRKTCRVYIENTIFFKFSLKENDTQKGLYCKLRDSKLFEISSCNSLVKEIREFFFKILSGHNYQVNSDLQILEMLSPKK